MKLQDHPKALAQLNKIATLLDKGTPQAEIAQQMNLRSPNVISGINLGFKACGFPLGQPAGSSSTSKKNATKASAKSRRRTATQTTA